MTHQIDAQDIESYVENFEISVASAESSAGWGRKQLTYKFGTYYLYLNKGYITEKLVGFYPGYNAYEAVEAYNEL